MESQKTVHRARVEALQKRMAETGIHGWIIPSSDPHQSEYYADYWKARGWVSGFTGSAGTLVVTRDQAALWTDGRYFLEAGEVLEGTGIQLMKEGVADTPGIAAWLSGLVPRGGVVSYDARMVAPHYHLSLEQELAAPGISLVPGKDLLEGIWQDRPSLPEEAVRNFPRERAGLSREQKLARLRQALGERGCSIMVISALDEVAWVLNLRGRDVAYNPVFYSYLTVGLQEGTILWIGPGKLDSGLEAELAGQGITLKPYDDLADWIARQPEDARFWVNPRQVSMALSQVLGADRVYWEQLPTTLDKARKTPAELASLDDCMVSDGRALVRFFSWLEQTLDSGQELTEYDAARRLSEFRGQVPDYQGDSFQTIVGYGPNGAVIHYGPEKEGARVIRGQGLLLVDSGGQYSRGTTDITRTIPVGGSVDREQRRMYTLVLQGHIALARAVFPRGTTGTQLDILARQPLWNQGLNYGHGTGHGVGFCLNVHEGPGRISPLANSVALEPGMVFSNEPGYYREGEFGIRIENLIVVEDHPDFPGYLRFRTLSFCPLELDLVDRTLLSDSQRDWINAYHRRTRELLSPGLEGASLEWLLSKARDLD
ncbi:aminopeptidase P family protein [Spirochaeta lutea]|uniref:Peptidase M24 n=1 Tax=Spirochaeta lutea TaxID=1480694 RepID=A0A098R258_9SPIO|nr:aminopeptidase P family protein [Spirochaeta lutea]KGE72797.1 hypothetical protein DC28_06095 [Spirochaeta lutea]